MLKELHLHIIDPASAAQRLMLQSTPASAPVLVGSDASCGVRLQGCAVDPIHAELFSDGEQWCIRDRASSGGTFVDGERTFISAVRLRVGHRVRLGSGNDAARFEVVVAAGECVGPAAAAIADREAKRERNKRIGWAIAMPTACTLALFAAWCVGVFMVTRYQARHRPPPPPTLTVDPKAVADANAILAAARLGTAPATLVNAHAVDEQSLAALIRQRDVIAPSLRIALEARLVEESRTITLRRLRKLIDERHRLETLAATDALARGEGPRLDEVQQRLEMLGIDAGKLHWQPGDDVNALAAQVNPEVLEKIRLRVVEAIEAIAGH